MSHLKSKSQKLLESADLLHDNKHYHAVPHCSYYACFQLLQHICMYKLGLDRRKLMELGKNKGEDSHNRTINEVLAYIDSQSQTDYQDIREIVNLKKLRMRADYDNVEIVFTDSTKAIKLYKAIIPILNKYCQ